jgi:hypothetical protein
VVWRNAVQHQVQMIATTGPMVQKLVGHHLPAMTADTMLLATWGALPGVALSQQVPLVELVGLL